MKLFELIITLSVIFSLGLLGLVLTVVEPTYPTFPSYTHYYELKIINSFYGDFETAYVTHYLEHGITASGYMNFPGSIACPRSVPFGQIVEIAGKKYVCLDRTAKRYDGRYDIFTTETKAEAMQWGKREEIIEFIK